MGVELSKTGRATGKTPVKTTTPWRDDMPSTSKHVDRPTISWSDEEFSSSLQDRALDYLIKNLAGAISSESSLKRLGVELGLKTPDIELALEMNRDPGKVVSEGSRMMLQNWMKSVEPSGRIPTLRAALKKVNLGELEEKYLLREFHAEALVSLGNELMRKRHLNLFDDDIAKYFFVLEIMGKAVTHKTSRVDELSLDSKDVTSLWKLGLHTSCPKLQKLNLHFGYGENVSSDIVSKACSPFHHLTHLCITGCKGTIDPESFSRAIITSCPQLSKLSIHHLTLHNEKATEIIGSVKTHPHLRNLELHCCESDMHLDPFIANVNSDGKLTVTVTNRQSSSSEEEEERRRIRRRLMEEIMAGAEEIDRIRMRMMERKRQHILHLQRRKEMPSITEKSSTSMQESSSHLGGESGIQVHEDETNTQEEKDKREKEEEEEKQEEEEEKEEKGKEEKEEKGKEEKEEGEEEEEEEKEKAAEEEDQCIATEKFPYGGVSGEGNVAPIEMECRKSVGVEGGKLQLDSFGIELEIPPGAIDGETPQDIALRVLTDTPDLSNSEDEISVCFGVQCLAHGMVLKSPVTFTIPHCAILSRLYNVKAVLYCGEGEYTPGAVVKERIQLPLSGIPSCVVMEDVIKFRVNHFTWWFFTFSKNDSLKGKRVCCLPMICTKMPVERTPVILHAHLYDDLMGNKEYAIQRWIKGLFSSKESWLEEELKLGYEKVHSETQIFIEPSKVDLTLMCSVNKGTPEKKTLSYMKMFRLGHNCMPFELDLRKQPDTVAVSLKVRQDDETELLFPINFTSYTEVKEQESSHKETEVEVKPAGQNDFDEMLRTVAKRVTKRWEIDGLGKALGFTPEETSRYIDTNLIGQEVTCDGTLIMLRDWRKKQTKDKESVGLKAALEESDQIHLASELFGT